MNQIIKVYADTNTLIANLAQHPDNADKKLELAAMDSLLKMKEFGQISFEIFKSRVSRKEVDRTTNPQQKVRLQGNLEKYQQILQDEKLLGYNIQSYRHTFISSPMISEILDEKLHAELTQRGLSPDDAHHISHAICNYCDVFLTHDMHSIVKPYRQWIEERFPKLKVFLPSELLQWLKCPSVALQNGVNFQKADYASF